MSVGLAPAVQPSPGTVPGSANSPNGAGRGVLGLSRHAAVIILLVVFAGLAGMPLVVTLWSSFKPTGLVTDPGWTLENYGQVWDGGRIVGTVLQTLTFSIPSAGLAVFFAFVISWIVHRTDIGCKRLVKVLTLLPMGFPPFLLAIGWVLLANPSNGALNTLLGHVPGLSDHVLDGYSLRWMIFVQALSVLPSAFLIVSPAVNNLDTSLEESAFMSGLSVPATLRRVTVPMLAPALLGAFIFEFIVGLVTFDIPGIMGLPERRMVLSTRLYVWLTQGPGGLPLYGRVSALTSAMFLVLLVLAVVYRRMTRNMARFVNITGKARHGTSVRLGRWRRPATVVVTGGLTALIVLPFGMLVWTSLTPYLVGFDPHVIAHLSFSQYSALADNLQLGTATRNTIILAVVCATAVAIIATASSWVVLRSRSGLRGVLDFFTFLPLALGGVVLGIALIYVYLRVRALPVYGTIWIIAIAQITVFLSYACRASSGVMIQMHPELEEAAHMSGASVARTLRKVTVPLMAPAIIGVWVWVAAHSIRELSLALVLQSGSNNTVATILWQYWESGRSNTAAAVGILLFLACATLIGVWLYATRESRTTRRSRLAQRPPSQVRKGVA